MVPQDYSLRLSAAYSPYEKQPNFAYGSISFSVAGLFEASLTHDGAIGSPTGQLKPGNLLGLRLQVIPQRDNFPGVSLFLNTMTQAQSEFLGDNDLQPQLPGIYERGLVAVSYDARTTAAGISLATILNDVFSFSASLGTREVVWQENWSMYTMESGLPTTLDGWASPQAERTNLRVDWSAGATARPVQQLAFTADIASVPFVEIDPTSLLIEARAGYVGTVGIRYYLPSFLTVDLYDRWFSEGRDGADRHQIRLGVSTNVQFQ
jgi:hypothetical protein